MFGQGYFGKSYFGGTYFGLNVDVIIIVKPKFKYPSDSSPGDDYESKTIRVNKKKFELNKDKVINQLIREDEELVAVIILAIKEGII